MLVSIQEDPPAFPGHALDIGDGQVVDLLTNYLLVKSPDQRAGLDVIAKHEWLKQVPPPIVPPEAEETAVGSAANGDGPMAQQENLPHEGKEGYVGD